MSFFTITISGKSVVINTKKFGSGTEYTIVSYNASTGVITLNDGSTLIYNAQDQTITYNNNIYRKN